MTVPVKTLPVYSATRDTLVTSLSLAEAEFTDSDFSYDPASDYRKALEVINAILLQLRSLAVSTLKEIDEAIADSELAEELTVRAEEAKDEAEALNEAAHSIDEIAGVVSKITGVVTGIAGLPFL
jgi:hypothetical protein